jgi:hypothetical protein
MTVYCVRIGDKAEWPHPYDNFAEMAIWAKDCCVSYMHYTVADTSDVSEWDWLATFTFETYEDSIAFRLRWKH